MKSFFINNDGKYFNFSGTIQVNETKLILVNSDVVVKKGNNPQIEVVGGEVMFASGKDISFRDTKIIFCRVNRSSFINSKVEFGVLDQCTFDGGELQSGVFDKGFWLAGIAKENTVLKRTKFYDGVFLGKDFIKSQQFGGVIAE